MRDRGQQRRFQSLRFVGQASLIDFLREEQALHPPIRASTVRRRSPSRRSSGWSSRLSRCRRCPHSPAQQRLQPPTRCR